MTEGHTERRRFSGRARSIAFLAVIAVVATLAVAGATIARQDDDTPGNRGFVNAYRTATRAYQDRIEATKERRTQAVEPDDAIALESYRAILAATEAARRDYGEARPPAANATAYTEFLQLLDQQVASLRQAESAAADKRRADVLAALKLYGVQLARWITLRKQFDDLAGYEGGPTPTATTLAA
jgi:hypothetical protein